MDANPYQPPAGESAVEPRSRWSWWRIARTTGAALASLFLLYVLWGLPIGGFHHMELRGLFGWLFINGEDPDPSSVFFVNCMGEAVPTCGLIPTVAATGFLGWAMWRICRWN